MSTESQIRANQQNAQHSTGPTSEAGKAASCMNNLRHGMTGAFRVLPTEDQDEFDRLAAALHAEHRPSTITEAILIEKMAQHFWLSQRAQRLQDITMGEDLPAKDQDRQFALFLRYQTTNDRGFHNCLNHLLKLSAEKRKARVDEAALLQRAEDVSKIGFESQRRHEAAQSIRDAAETRKQELHKSAVMLAEAKLTHQQILNLNLEMDSHDREIAQTRPQQTKKAA